MAKAQGKKKAATAARRATSKAATRVKSVARAVTRKVKAAPAKPAKKVVKAAKAVKTVAKAAARPAAKKPPKPAKRAAAAASPAKRGPALTVKPVAVPPPAPRGLVAPKVPAAPAPEKKTRTRRARPRVHSNGAPVAAWLPQDREKPRPSSFIPAPPRAEAPSLIAAPPASSDRLIRPEDVTEFVTRTVPIRVDIEQGGGKFYIGVNPEEVTLRAGEGIEWDFRYLGGADVTADELVIEFEKPSPFSHGVFKSRKPGTARPHRQLSGPAHKTSAGKRVKYTIKAMTPFKTELAAAKLWVSVSA